MPIRDGIAVSFGVDAAFAEPTRFSGGSGGGQPIAAAASSLATDDTFARDPTVVSWETLGPADWGQPGDWAMGFPFDALEE